MCVYVYVYMYIYIYIYIYEINLRTAVVHQRSSDQMKILKDQSARVLKLLVEQWA